MFPKEWIIRNNVYHALCIHCMFSCPEGSVLCIEDSPMKDQVNFTDSSTYKHFYYKCDLESKTLKLV